MGIIDRKRNNKGDGLLGQANTARGPTVIHSGKSQMYYVLVILLTGLIAFSYYFRDHLRDTIRHFVSTEAISFTEEESLEVYFHLIDASAHPEDPNLPEGAVGVDDETVAGYDAEFVDFLLSDSVIEEAYSLEDPVLIAGLGRVAYWHDYDELSFSLFELATEYESAVAYYYISNYYPDDPSHRKELLLTALSLNFPPAVEAVNKMSNIGNETKGLGNSAPGILSDDTNHFDSANQYDSLKFLATNEVSMAIQKIRVPVVAPDFLQKNMDIVEIRELFFAFYACKLAIAIGTKASEEIPIYLGDGTPLLVDLVDGNLAASARLYLNTGKMRFFNKSVGITARVHSIKPVIETILKEGDLESKAKGFIKEYVAQDRRLKGVDELGKSMEEQARLDTIQIQNIYYRKNSEIVRRLYKNLSSYIYSKLHEINELQ